MRESTKRALEAATKRLERDGYKLTADGLKYHAGRDWLGLLEKEAGVVRVHTPNAYDETKPEDLLVIVYQTKGVVRLHDAPTKGKKKDDS